MTHSPPLPTDRMKALYKHHVAIFGEPTDLISFDTTEATKPSHFSQMYVGVWAADDDCDVTTLLTLGMSENQMVGTGVTRVELHFAIRASLSHEETHEAARFLMNLAEYPFDHNLQLGWWHRLRDVGTIPCYPGKNKILLRPPFIEGGCREATYDGEAIRFLYVVPITAEENNMLSQGVDAYEDYLIENDLDPLGQREE